MIPDLAAVLWKEGKEMFLQRGSVRRGVFWSVFFPAAFLGVFLPWQMGAKFVTAPGTASIWIGLPAVIVILVVGESFAGERERKTLETLLASRLSDRAILFGKILAMVAYAWGITTLSLLLGLVTVNALHGHGRVLLFSANLIGFSLTMSLLTATAAACGGVLISLRASTVRQAMETISMGLMGTMGTAVVAAKLLPKAARQFLRDLFSGANLVRSELTLLAAALAVCVILTAAAMARFRRARLILD